MKKIILSFSLLLIVACSQAPKTSLSASRANPNAPLAFFSLRCNLDDDMRLKYADAMQRAGIFNFIAEDFSEAQIENAVEVYVDYNEKKVKFNGVPVLILETQILKDEQVKFGFTITEESDVSSTNPRAKNKEKKHRQEVLLQRFIEELKRLNAEEKTGA